MTTDTTATSAGLREFGLFIDRQEVPAARSVESLNPYNGKPWAVVPDATCQRL
jgi:hypothetical protein